MPPKAPLTRREYVLQTRAVSAAIRYNTLLYENRVFRLQVTRAAHDLQRTGQRLLNGVARAAKAKAKAIQIAAKAKAMRAKAKAVAKPKAKAKAVPKVPAVPKIPAVPKVHAVPAPAAAPAAAKPAAPVPPQYIPPPRVQPAPIIAKFVPTPERGQQDAPYQGPEHARAKQTAWHGPFDHPRWARPFKGQQ